MSFRMRFFLIIFVVMILAACTAKEKPTLKIGMNMEFPPFASRVDGAFVGVDVDLARKIAEKLEQPYEIIPMDFDNLIPAVMSGKIDCAISAISITEERAWQVEFSQGYYVVNQAVIAREGSPIVIHNTSDISKYKLGLTNGTTAHHWVQNNLLMKNLLPVDQIFLYPDIHESLQDLIKGEVDLVLNDAVAVQGYEDRLPITTKYLIQTDESYGIAMHIDGKYNQKIKAALQDILDSGEMRSIIQTHIE